MLYTRALLATVAVFGLMTAGYALSHPGLPQSSPSLSALAEASKSEKLNLNTASAKELGKVKGLSKAKAKNIELHRKKNGNFKALDDLKLVKGFKKVKPETLKLIQDQLKL